MLTGYFVVAPGAPVLPAAGCLDSEAALGAWRSDLVVLRVYENKEMPDPVRYAEAGVIAATAHRKPGQRVILQGGNEPNNGFEHWNTDPRGYRDWFAAWSAAVAALDPTLERWWAGMSPGYGPAAWYAGCEAADGAVLHAYGLSADELMLTPRTFRQLHPTVPWLIGETNHGPGAGRVVDRDRWADDVLTPCLRESFDLGCQAVLYFVHSGWTQDDPSVGQATPPTAQGTRIEAVLAGWRDPAPAVVPPADPPPPEVKPMIKRCYLWQFDQLGERSVAEIAATLRLGGVAEVACKTHHELTWLGNARDGDSSPLAFHSLGDVERRFDEFAAEGILMVPWCVPMGTKVAAEVARAVEVGRACGGSIELDTEPYAEFWEGPYDLLEPYTDGIQAAGVAYEVNFDARPGGWHPYTAAQFARVCRDAALVWTQSYWGTAGFGPVDEVVSAALATLDVLEVPAAKRGIIFPSFGHAQYAAAAALLAAAGVDRAGMWRMGDAGPPVYAALGAIPSAVVPPPAPVDATTDALNGLWSLTEHLAGIEHTPLAEEFQRKIADLKTAIGR